MYVRPEVAAEIIRNPDLLKPTTRPVTIDFVFVMLQWENPEQLSQRISEVVTLGRDLDGTTLTIVGCLVIIVFGAPIESEHSANARGNLVQAIGARFGSEAKIVHGATAAHIGNMGSNFRIAYNVAFQSFEDVLARLIALAPGGVEEFHQ